MVSWRSIWCNSFCGVFVGIRWTLSLWSDLYIHESYLSLLWYPICMISYSLVFLLRIFDLFRPTRSIFLAMGRGALWWVRSCGVLSQWQKGQQDTYWSLLLRITRWGLFLHEYIMSTSCHRSYCITPFFHELNTLDACWIAVDVWSNSSRCSVSLYTH